MPEVPTRRREVCVIGSGLSGLVAIKELLQEGHDVTCFERYDAVGGVFYHSPDKGGAYDSLRLTVSNYFMAYSSYYPERDERDFWTGAEYAAYLEGFVREFGLREHIRFGHEIVRVEKGSDGRFEVDARPSGGGETVTHAFDAVAICSGTNQIPRYPEVPGIESFPGTIEHSAYYKNAEPYRGRRVLCIGIGETAADVVHEVSRVASRFTLCVRHCQALIERYPLGRRHPNDAYTSMVFHRLSSAAMNTLVKITNGLRLRLARDPVRRRLARWNLDAGEYFNQFYTKNEVFVRDLVEGRVELVRSGIGRVEKSTVVFGDGRREDFDTIVFSTGYRDDFSFVRGIELDDVRDLYKHVFHPTLGERVAFIGWARPTIGGVPACSEMQARWFALVLSGKRQLPPEDVLARRIRSQADYENRFFRASPDQKTLVHYSRYIESLAKLVGCSPWTPRLLLQPRLLARLWFGSQLSFAYRLRGEHALPELALPIVMRLPIAWTPVERIGLVLWGALFRALALLRLAPADPPYRD